MKDLRQCHALLVAAQILCRASEPRSLLSIHLVKTPLIQVYFGYLIGFDDFPLGNTSASTIDFFDNVFTFFNESVTVNCCHLNNTLELATCGLGASCAGTCSALGATLCPSGDCTGDCEIPFEQETADNRAQRNRISVANIDQRKIKWCTNKCNVWKNKVCCYHPVCRDKSKSHKRRCSWFNYLTGNW